MAYRILVIDDEENMLELYSRILGKEGYKVTTALTAEEALDLFGSKVFDLIIADLALPGMNGVELLKKVKEEDPDIPYILITAYGTVESAVEAMKLGAFDYIPKPFQTEELKIVIKKALKEYQLAQELKRLRSEVKERYSFGNIVGRSKKMLAIFDLVGRVAASNSTVLIQGESGTGKELIARAIHYNSLRKDKPFVAIDCSILPETLLESELFGHVRGAFTGAMKAKKGLFEEANGGTIFLDEIGNISLPIQAKLLRVLQEREIKPLGSTETIKVDVRIIAATNTDLKELVASGAFREDLYYRIAVIPIVLPPLRERKEDIPLLVDCFLEKFSKENNKPLKRITPKALALLTEYDWPGNVRELENIIERAVLVSDSEEIDESCFPSEIRRLGDESVSLNISLKGEVNKVKGSVEIEAIKKALALCGGNKTLAAKKLGISRSSLYNKLKEYGIK
ncbi:MAG: sigma-54-dependent Fis family transcriptional regulator [Acidobacteria bacterium]|nr:sigma-54-dependent Fis family transcriptional regulator [Acidobacteriota bacterium]